MKTHLKKLVSLVLAFAFCFALGTTALAQNATGTEVQPATATIVKELQIPEGTTTPQASFTFTLTALSPADAPEISDKTISFTTDQAATDQKVLGTADLFSDVTFPHAGIYQYIVKETSDTYATVDGEVMTYSHAEYTLTVVVANGANDGDLYIKEIVAQQVKDDAGLEGEEAEKVTPNPTDPTNPASDGVRFVNTYAKNKGTVDPTNPTNALLTIEKQVAGDIGVKTKAFAFTISATNAQTAPAEAQTVKAQVIDANSSVVGEELTIGSDTTVHLKHGEKLVFTNLYAGATVSFKETDALIAEAGYQVTASVQNGDQKTEYQQADVTTSGVTVSPISENQASAVVTNTLNSTSPTGLVMNNLPFILMIALATAGLVLYVSMKRRRADR